MKRSVGLFFVAVVVAVAVAFRWEVVLAQVHSFPAYESKFLVQISMLSFCLFVCFFFEIMWGLTIVPCSLCAGRI